MKVYQPDIFPFNIMIASMKEAESFDDFTTFNGAPIKEFMDTSALGMVIKAYRYNSDHTSKTAYSLILFSEKPSVKTITHEAFHATQDLLEMLDIVYEVKGTNEVYAYVMGYISDCIEHAINNYISWE